MAKFLSCFLNYSKVRALLTGLIIGTFFCVSSFLGLGFELSAQAATITPESRSYQVETLDHDDNLINNSQNKLSEIAENVKEKLNLDEELPVSTKKFFNQVEEAVTGDSQELPSQKIGTNDDGNHNFVSGQ